MAIQVEKKELTKFSNYNEPYYTEFDEEYNIEWYNMRDDISKIIEIEMIRNGSLTTTTDYYEYSRGRKNSNDNFIAGERLFIDGDDQTLLVNIKNYLIANIKFFDVSPLNLNNYQNVKVCRIAGFRNQNNMSRLVKLCYVPNSFNQSPYIRTERVMRFGNVDIHWEEDRQVISIIIYVLAGLVALGALIFLLVIGGNRLYKKFGSNNSARANEYQAV